MTIPLLLIIVLVIAVIVIATKVREHSKKIAKLEQQPPTTIRASTATPTETSQTSEQD